MTPTRRHFLAGSAALAAATPLRAQISGSPATRPATDTAVGTGTPTLLRATPGSLQLAPAEFPATPIWGYDGRAPGPEIRLTQGMRLSRRLENDLPQATTIHWHGLRIPNAMDGVPDMTQGAVAPGAGFDYDFLPPDAGTFWYHSHNRSWEQMARGLHGAFIVEEPEGAPDVDAEHVLILDDWRLRDDAMIEDDFDNLHDASHSGRLGNLITVNGNYDLKLAAKAGDRLRLRIINAANGRIFQLAPSGFEGWIVALDGMPLEVPEPLESALVLAPAQRVDLVVDITAEPGGEAFLVGMERGEGFALATFAIGQGNGGQGKGIRRDAAPAALPPNPVTMPVLRDARVQKLNMNGGAMRAVSTAMFDGRAMNATELMDKGMFWAFNGVAGMTDTPLAQVALGETLRIPIRNDTMFAHAMHLHGHHFREVLADDSLGPWRDTLLILPDETRDIAFVADNPGKWMLHCHMLAHQSAGMMTWVEVTA